MDRTTQNVTPTDRAVWVVRDVWYRELLVQALMRTPLVVVGDEFLDHSVQVALVQHDDMVQQLPA